MNLRNFPFLHNHIHLYQTEQNLLWSYSVCSNWSFTFLKVFKIIIYALFSPIPFQTYSSQVFAYFPYATMTSALLLSRSPTTSSLVNPMVSFPSSYFDLAAFLSWNKCFHLLASRISGFPSNFISHYSLLSLQHLSDSLTS